MYFCLAMECSAGSVGLATNGQIWRWPNFILGQVETDSGL
jgi:hypothetical protein